MNITYHLPDNPLSQKPENEHPGIGYLTAWAILLTFTFIACILKFLNMFKNKKTADENYFHNQIQT